VESQRQALVHGLLGEYFDNADLTGLKRSKIDEIVDFDWVNNPPTTGDGIGADTFSVRWTGFVEARFTETYTFITRTDDGVRLWVNGTQIINDWNNHSITERQGTIALTAGERVPIRLEYYDNTGNASAHLRWKSAHEPEDAIPTAQLTSPVPTCNDSPGLVSHWRFDEEPAAPSPGASFTVLENDYDGPQWWGTIKFRNEGPSTSSNFKVEFDVPQRRALHRRRRAPGGHADPADGQRHVSPHHRQSLHFHLDQHHRARQGRDQDLQLLD
jgi:hypothetical protein